MPSSVLVGHRENTKTAENCAGGPKTRLGRDYYSHTHAETTLRRRVAKKETT